MCTSTPCAVCQDIISSHARVIETLRHENSDQGSEIVSLIEEIVKLKESLSISLKLNEKLTKELALKFTDEETTQ